MKDNFVDPNLFKKKIHIDDGPEIKGNKPPKDDPKPKPQDLPAKY